MAATTDSALAAAGTASPGGRERALQDQGGAMARRFFGTDGIRGLANSPPMTSEIALKVGMAAGKLFSSGQHRHRVVIGKDTRLSGYMFETALAPDEIITAVEFPLPARAAYAKFPNPASRFALVGVFVAQAGNGDVRVAVTGAASSVFRATAIEAALRKSFTPDAAKATRVDASGLNNDLHGSAEYRAHLVSVMAARAVAACAGA